MLRRNFLGLVGAAFALPLAARAQSGKSATIGFLGANTASIQQRYTAALVQRLGELGWIEGRNLRIEYRWAEGRYDRSPGLIAELVESKVDVIVTHAPPNVLAAKRVTSDIPIVFAAVGDPVGIGLVNSLARPGGNVTGLSLQSADLSGKRLQLVRELLPQARRLAVVGNASSSNNVMERGEIQKAAQSLGFELVIPEIRTLQDIAPVMETLKERADALFVQTDPLTNTNRVQINALALGLRLPTNYGVREFAEAGGLMSYGPSFADLFRRSADFVDRILRGAKPGDIPVEQPTKFELIINLKTAKTLSLPIPPTLLARADEVIE
ncbi:MAG: ABC transporter substrate-binding protein [Pseudorhodoplanes sp.]|uniref:ABC transporter substrate-binding protein n=1 Tax=Pseudorhodoplanes sp. TaxID=1934341 RepID=UPI003D13BEC8